MAPGRARAAPRRDLLCGSRRPAALRLHRPEHARGAEAAQRAEHGEVGLAPGRAEEARRRARGLGDGVVAVADLPRGAVGPAAPEARVAPGVVAQVVTAVRDPAGHRGGVRGAPADQEESALDALALQDVEDPRRALTVRPVVEGERDGRGALASRSTRWRG